MCAEPAKESSPLNNLYTRFESIAKKEKCTLDKDAITTKIATEYLLSLEEHQGKITFTAHEKPWGWGLWHSVQKFFGIRGKSYNLKNFMDKARDELAKTNLQPAEKEQLRVILNKTIDHVNQSRKAQDKIAEISAGVITGSSTNTTPPASPPSGPVAPLPPPSGGTRQKSAITEEKLQERYPGKSADFIKFLVEIPAIKTEFQAKRWDKVDAVVPRLLELYNKKQQMSAACEKIKQNQNLAPILTRLGLETAESKWSDCKSIDILMKVLPDIEKSYELVLYTAQLEQVSAQFSAVQKRASALKTDPFFSSFCEHLLQSATPLLTEMMDRSFSQDPFSNPSVQGPPYTDKESFARFKDHMEKVVTQYEKALTALESVKETVEKDFPQPVKSKKQFLEEAMGASTIKEWEAMFEKAVFPFFHEIRGGVGYQNKVQLQFLQDCKEANGTAMSHEIDRGYWHAPLAIQRELMKLDLQETSLDKYVNGIIVICEGIKNAHGFYREILNKSNEMSQKIDEYRNAQKPQPPVLPQTRLNAKSFFAGIVENKEYSVDQLVRAEKSGTRPEIKKGVRDFKLVEKAGLEKSRKSIIDKAKEELKLCNDQLTENEKKLEAGKKALGGNSVEFGRQQYNLLQLESLILEQKKLLSQFYLASTIRFSDQLPQTTTGTKFNELQLTINKLQQLLETAIKELGTSMPTAVEASTPEQRFADTVVKFSSRLNTSPEDEQDDPDMWR